MYRIWRSHKIQINCLTSEKNYVYDRRQVSRHEVHLLNTPWQQLRASKF